MGMGEDSQWILFAEAGPDKRYILYNPREMKYRCTVSVFVCVHTIQPVISMNVDSYIIYISNLFIYIFITSLSQVMYAQI